MRVTAVKRPRDMIGSPTRPGPGPDRRRRGLPRAAALALLSAPLTVSPSSVLAQDSEQNAEQHYDIPAQPISAALAAFANQTHVNIAFRPQVTGSIRSHAIRGRYTPQMALTLLLAGTGLGTVFTGPRSAIVYALDAPPPPERPIDENGFPLITLDTAEVRATRIIGTRPPAMSSLDYAHRAQARIRAILAANLEYERSPYRARIGITIDKSGRIADVLVTRSEAKVEHDAQVRAMLLGLNMEDAPPDTMVQPIWFRISTDELFSTSSAGRRRP